MSARLDKTRDEAGFTLLELLVVIAILALVSAVAAPALMRPADGVRLQAAAADLQSTLQRARSAAIAGNRDVAVEINVETRAVQSANGLAFRLDPDIALRLTVADIQRGSKSRGSFRFHADGSSTGGNITLTLQSREAHLCVDWLTGRTQRAQQC